MGISYPVTTTADLEPPFHSQDACGSVLLRLAYNMSRSFKTWPVGGARRIGQRRWEIDQSKSPVRLTRTRAGKSLPKVYDRLHAPHLSTLGSCTTAHQHSATSSEQR